MMKKSLLANSLALALCIGLSSLSGCGNNAPQNVSQGSNDHSSLSVTNELSVPDDSSVPDEPDTSENLDDVKVEANFGGGPVTDPKYLEGDYYGPVSDGEDGTVDDDTTDNTQGDNNESVKKLPEGHPVASYADCDDEMVRNWSLEKQAEYEEMYDYHPNFEIPDGALPIPGGYLCAPTVYDEPDDIHVYDGEHEGYVWFGSFYRKMSADTICIEDLEENMKWKTGNRDYHFVTFDEWKKNKGYE